MSDEPPCAVTFETVFASVYQRNNKAKAKSGASASASSAATTKVGMKNIRCFPCHSPQGHVEHGFCGSTVAFSVVCSSQQQELGLRAWAQFDLADAKPMYAVGELVPLAHITGELERSRTARTKPWLPAQQQQQSSASSTRFIVNQERLGYNYGWVSNVHSCHSKHCLQVYLFREVEQAEAGDKAVQLQCVQVAKSSEFAIVCSRSSGRQSPPPPPLHTTATTSTPPPTIISPLSSPSPPPPPPPKRAKRVDENLQRTAESLLMLASGGQTIFCPAAAAPAVVM